MRGLVLSALLAAAPAAAEVGDRVIVYFVCDTADSASFVGRGLAVEGNAFLLPDDCTWLHGRGVPDQAAVVTEEVDHFVVNGKFVEVGRVTVNRTRHGYSAGLTEALLF